MDRQKKFALLCLAALGMFLGIRRPAHTEKRAAPFSIQAAIDAAGRGGTVHIPKGEYLLDAPLNCRDKYGLELMGEGAGTTLIPRFKDAPVIDMTGSARCSIRSLRIKADANSPGLVGLMLARNEKKQSAGQHYFANLVIEGNWKLACVYNIASEINRWDACAFTNAEAGGNDFILTDRNSLGVQSPFGVISGYPDNDSTYTFTGCHFGVYGYSGTETNLIVQNSSDINLLGCSFSNKPRDPANPKTGGAAVIRSERLSTPGYNSGLIIQGCHVEAYGAKHFLYVTGETDSVLLSYNSILTAESVVLADAPCDDWTIRGGRMESQAAYDWGGAVRPLLKFKQLTNSDVQQTSVWSRLAHDVPATSVKGRRFATASVQVTDRAAGNVFRAKEQADVVVPQAVGNQIRSANQP